MDILRKIYYFLLDFVETFLIAAAIFLVVYVLLVRPFEVKGDSMFPNFFNKERIFTNLIGFQDLGFYHASFGKLERGDVVVFKAPPNEELDYIKRVIGLPGDKIMLRKGSVYLNGNLLDESKYLSPEIVTQEESFLKENQTVTVPPDEYFVLGDNRPASSDSRDWGFVKKSLIIGKSTFIFWPLNKLGFIKNPYKN